MFGTTLNYVTLRLLGVDAEHPVMIKARGKIHKLGWFPNFSAELRLIVSIGGATGIPAWGKFWLSVLNVYEWEGNNPIPPELWYVPHELQNAIVIFSLGFYPSGFLFIHTDGGYILETFTYQCHIS